MNSDIISAKSAAQFLLFTLSIAWLTIICETAVQCNIGLKLFSTESGNAICALLPTHFNCIESCEWNTSCSLTSHYNAFRGRRTYVSGMVITSTTFIVQCCASLGTIVEMNTLREPKCVWVPRIETVEERGSMRFDPPLAPNEYVREIVAERLEKGRVNLRVQICKFTTQQADCDKAKLSQEDANFHKLLLFRLNHTKELLSHGTSTNTSDTSQISKSANSSRLSDQFRDDKLMSGHIQRTSRQPPQAPLRLQSSIIQERKDAVPMAQRHIADTTVIGESDSLDNYKQSASFSFGQGSGRNDVKLPHGVLQFLSDSVSISHQNQQPIRPHLAPGVFGTKNRNNDAAISPRYHTLRLPNSLKRIDVDSKDLADASNTKVVGTEPSSVLNDDPIISPASSFNLQRFINPANKEPSFYNEYGPPAIAASNTWHSQQNWPLPLHGNASTDELIPTSYWRRLVHRQQTSEVNKLNLFGPFGPNQTLVRPMLHRNNKFALQTLDQQTLDNDEFVLKNAVQADKINQRRTFYIEAPRQISSDDTESPDKIGFFQAPVQRFYSNNSNLIIRRPFTSTKQRQFRIQRLRHDKHQQQQLLQQQHQQQQQFIQQNQRQNWPDNKSAANYRPIFYEEKDQKAERQLKANLMASAAALSGLLACCQQQAPGCKHLCSKDVSKEEIKHALVTQQCPPLSMTSVIQCFPRHYNVTPVTQCCSRNAQHQHVGASTLTNPNRLPDQCLGLCAPDFKLSFSHFACIDHISTIVECYRDLLQ